MKEEIESKSFPSKIFIRGLTFFIYLFPKPVLFNIISSWLIKEANIFLQEFL